MSDITNPTLIRAYTQKHDFHFKKKLGQNFLIDGNIARKIVESLDIKENDAVLEIGPGAGALTQSISQLAKEVLAVEIDPFAVKILSDVFCESANVTIINYDFMKLDVFDIMSAAKDMPAKAISNLPYYITSPIIMKLLESRYPFERIIVTMQKEVAKRLGSKPGTKDYSVFTIAVDYFAETEYLFDIPSSAFMPAPSVDSAVVAIIPRKQPKVDVSDEDIFFKTVKAGFAMRRKTILNCLDAGFELSKQEITQALENCKIAPGVRAETLDIETLGRLSDEIKKLL